MICGGAGQAAVTKTNDGWTVCVVSMNDVEKAVCTPSISWKTCKAHLVLPPLRCTPRAAARGPKLLPFRVS